MNGPSVFDRLVKNMASEERKDLLDKIQSSVSVSEEPLTKEIEETETFDPELELREFSLWQRFLLFLKSLLTNKDKYTLISEKHLKKLEQQIERQCSSLIDYRNSLFVEKMHYELSALQKGLSFFQEHLGQALGREKRYFFAFLAGIELEHFQERLVKETDPFNLWETIKPLDEEDVRIEMRNRFQELFEAVSEEEKREVYRDAQSIFSLYNLSSHPFESMLSRFESKKYPGAMECDFQDLSKYLTSLAGLLNAAIFPPSANALRALFLFYYRDKLENEDFNLELQLKNYLIETERAFIGIREFNEHIPMIPIIRYINKDFTFFPAEAGGGEDWFVIYKDFWEKRIDKAYQIFYKYQTRQKLTDEVKKFLRRGGLPELHNYKSEKHGLSLSFLRGFFESTFINMSRALKLIFLNGEFYKEENRQDYTEAFNILSKIAERITSLENRLEETGDLGINIKDVRKEMISSKLKKKKIQNIIARADKEALEIIEESGKQLRLLTLLLEGVLEGQPGAQYDTLSNFESIGGQENKELVASWRRALEKIEEASALLTEIKDLEIRD